MHKLTQKDRMTPAERMKGLIRRESIDRVPFDPRARGLAARLFGVDRGVFYRDPQVAFDAGMHMMQLYPWMNAGAAYGWIEIGAWEFGGEVVWPDNNRYAAPGCGKPVVKKPEDVDALPDPDPLTAGMNPLLHRFNEIKFAHGQMVALPAGTPTNHSFGICGASTFLRWVIKYPEAVHKLQRRVTDFILRTSKYIVDTYGADRCTVFPGFPNESTQLLSPEMFEKFCLPYIRELFHSFKEWGVTSMGVHLCGNHTGNLHYWKDVELTPRSIFFVGNEMDLEQSAESIGPDHVIAGNISNTILQRGTPEEVYEDVVRCLKAGMKHPGGFVLMPACEITAGVPLENLDAIADALYDHGFYE
jgi:uroporphyrinogen decarboxylase